VQRHDLDEELGHDRVDFEEGKLQAEGVDSEEEDAYGQETE